MLLVSEGMSIELENVKTRASKTKLTMELIDNIMTDKYHGGLTNNDLKKKYNISHATLKTADEKYGELFKEKYGVKAKTVKEISPEEMKAYWDKVKK